MAGAPLPKLRIDRHSEFIEETWEEQGHVVKIRKVTARGAGYWAVIADSKMVDTALTRGRAREIAAKEIRRISSFL